MSNQSEAFNIQKVSPKRQKYHLLSFFFDTDSTKKPYISNLNEISVWPTCYGRKNRLVNNETVAAEQYIFCTEKNHSHISLRQACLLKF